NRAEVDVYEYVARAFHEVAQVEEGMGFPGASTSVENLMVCRIQNRREGPGRHIRRGKCSSVSALRTTHDTHKSLVDVLLPSQRHYTPNPDSARRTTNTVG